MLVRNHWEVLVVDDEPDVLAVTRLALKQIQVYGIPLRIHEFSSAADAIKYLKRTAALPDLALAVVDVVMETDHAGLDVCRFIRDELANRVTPIVVRTGQAGKAPERDVIERYDISTYLTKVEATTDKLHATVVNAIRNYQHVVLHEAILGLATWISSQDRLGIVRGFPEISAGFLADREGIPLEGAQYHFCILTDEDTIPVGNFKGRETEVRALRDRLAKDPSKQLNRNGDSVAHAGEHVLFSLARNNGAPAFDIVGETNYRYVPDYITRAVHSFSQCIRNQLTADQRR